MNPRPPTNPGVLKRMQKLIGMNPYKMFINLIRGTNPQPGAWTTKDGGVLKIFDAELVRNAKGEIGEIVEINNNGFIVMANGGGILIKRVRPDGSGKISAGDWLKDSGVTVGTILGN